MPAAKLQPSRPLSRARTRHASIATENNAAAASAMGTKLRSTASCEVATRNPATPAATHPPHGEPASSRRHSAAVSSAVASRQAMASQSAPVSPRAAYTGASSSDQPMGHTVAATFAALGTW